MKSNFKHIPIETLDKPRILYAPTSVIMFVEEKTGHGFMAMLKRISEDPRHGDLAMLLWAALRHEEPQMTLEDAANLLNWDNFGDVTEKVIDAYGMAKEKKTEESPFVESAGSTSGPSPDTTSG